MAPGHAQSPVMDGEAWTTERSILLTSLRQPAELLTTHMTELSNGVRGRLAATINFPTRTNNISYNKIYNNMLDQLINNSKVISDRHPEFTNTPLTVQELKLVTVETDGCCSSPVPPLSSHARTEELAWVIPLVIGCVLVLVLVALLLYFGLRMLELKCLGYCTRTCGRCCPCLQGHDGEEFVSLTSDRETQHEMTQYRTTSASRME